MTVQENELIRRVENILKNKSETKNLEVKNAKGGAPRIYETLSAFSNSEGGVIVFGINENSGFILEGVYNSQDLQTRISEQCKEMEPEVRAIITTARHNDCDIISAEIPEIDHAVKPCYHIAKGQKKGSYLRIGNTNALMTGYEIYSYDAYRRKICDDIRKVERATGKKIDTLKRDRYLIQLKTDRPNLNTMPLEELLDINSLVDSGIPTLVYVMLFSIYPQAILPALCINAVVVPGYEIGETTVEGARFIDNKKIEGTLEEQISGAIAFVRKNMTMKTTFNKTTGQRKDIPEYPPEAIREAVLNAVVHRDYSFYTENMPIQICMFKDRLEITNPGGLYGRMTIDNIGKMQPDVRNPNIIKALEIMGATENRYSGIPTIQRKMEEHGLPEPLFINERGSFKVILYNSAEIKIDNAVSQKIINFCKQERTLDEITSYLNINSKNHVRDRYLKELLAQGIIQQTIPERPGSKYQKYVLINRKP